MNETKRRILSISVAIATSALFATSPLIGQLDCFNKNPEALYSDKAVGCACAKPMSAQDPSGMEVEVIKLLDTPEARFKATLTEFETAVLAYNKDLSLVQVEDGVSIRVDGPGGRFFELLFDENGYVSKMNDHTGSIRFHKEGLFMYGFDAKIPSLGLSDYAPLVTVNEDADGFIASGEFNQIGYSWTVFAPEPTNASAANARASLQKGMFLETPEAVSKAYARCKTKCDSTRNEASRTARAEYEKCRRDADIQLQNCIDDANADAIKWGVGAGLGVGIGVGVAATPLVGVIAGIGTTLITTTVGMAVNQAACYRAAGRAQNECKTNLNYTLETIVANHKSCVQQCKADARSGSNQ